jgi:hypothetical protein
MTGVTLMTLGKTAKAAFVAAALALCAQGARAEVFGTKWECPDGTWWLYTYNFSETPPKVVDREQQKPLSYCNPKSVGRVTPQPIPAPVNRVGPLQPARKG